MEIRKLDEMFEVLRSKPKKRLVAVYANDDHTICAVNAAVENGLIEATLVGDEATIAAVCKAENINMANFKIVQESEEVKAAAPDGGSPDDKRTENSCDADGWSCS